MPLPNFLIIGAAKSGTTALYRYLKQHPEIFMSSRKEPHFFSFTNESKITNGPGDYVKSAITDFNLYRQLFDPVTNQKAIGEASPTYIYVPGTAEKIHSVLPNVKLIAILRNPVDRAFSAYMHQVRDGHEDSKDFLEAIYRETERIANNWGPIWHYINAGYYYNQLIPYYNLFNKNNIKIIIYDDFVNNPVKEIQDIFTFLEVNNMFVPDMSARPNVSGIPKHKTWQRIMDFTFNHPNPIRGISRKLFSEEFRWKVTSHLRNKNLIKPTITLELRKELINLYKSDIVNLQKLINRDLSAWLVYP